MGRTRGRARRVFKLLQGIFDLLPGEVILLSPAAVEWLDLPVYFVCLNTMFSTDSQLQFFFFFLFCTNKTVSPFVHPSPICWQDPKRANFTISLQDKRLSSFPPLVHCPEETETIRSTSDLATAKMGSHHSHLPPPLPPPPRSLTMIFTRSSTQPNGMSV